MHPPKGFPVKCFDGIVWLICFYDPMRVIDVTKFGKLDQACLKIQITGRPVEEACPNQML